jgi:hypothetical protein
MLKQIPMTPILTGGYANTGKTRPQNCWQMVMQETVAVISLVVVPW